MKTMETTKNHLDTMILVTENDIDFLKKSIIEKAESLAISAAKVAEDVKGGRMPNIDPFGNEYKALTRDSVELLQVSKQMEMLKKLERNFDAEDAKK